MDDDDVDFFTRKPLPSKSKAKAKPKPLAKPANGIDHKLGEGSGSNSTQPHTSSAAVPAPSAPASTSIAAQLIGDSDDDDDDGDIVRDIDVDGKDEDDDEDTLLYSSDLDVSSDDSDPKRRAKRRKKKHTKILPAWASQRVYRRPSQEPSSSSSTDVFHDAQSVLPSSSKSNGVVASTDNATGKAAPNGSQGDKSTVNGKRGRGVSLTPPPPPSPEKLSAARNLVTKVIGSKISTSYTSAPTAAASTTTTTASAPRRSTRSSATPGVGNDAASASALSPVSSRRGAGAIEDDEDIDGVNQINWDPDLARLMRGQNAKHIREQAKREQQERDAKRKQRELERIRQQPSSLPGSSQRQGQFSRTQSAPQARSGVVRIAEDGNDTDDSVEFVARPTKPSTSPRRTRSSAAAGNAASQSQTTRNNSKDAAIVIDDSDDDVPASKRNGSQNGISQTIDDDDDDAGDVGGSGDAEQETLELTLQSRLGPMQVTVTPTTKLLTITTHFHAKQNLGDKVKPDKIKVMFDGFAFKPTQAVADMDVEDGDQVELSWPS